MSAVRIDVTWRGLEVGRQVPLHSVTEASGRIDVPLPMPVGSALALRAADGLEIPAVVTRVFEQSTAGGETPGMVVTPTLAEEARGWWQARAEESAAAVPEAAASAPEDEPAMVVAPADPTSRPTMVFTAVDLSAPASPALSAPVSSPAVTPPVSSPALSPPPPSASASAAQPTAPVIEVIAPAPTTLPEFAPVPPAAAPTAVAAFGPVASPPRDDDDASGTRLMFGAAAPEAPEDTSRTTVMPAVDLEAIMADGAAHAADVASTDEDDSGAVDGPINGETSGEISTRMPAVTAGGKPRAPRGKRRKGR